MSSRNTDLALLVLRVTFGLSMIYGHGYGKLMRLFSGEEIKFMDPFGIGPEASLALVVFAEVICAGLITIGLFTRLATTPLIIAMGVAVFVAHGGDEFAKVEKALLYLMTFVALSISGAGNYSIDRLIKKRQ